MDDSLEQPNAMADPFTERHDEDQENSSGDEDGGLDWTKIPSGAGRPVIPKRGEKDFEPNAAGGSGLQVHVLDRARSAMADALKATRATSSKSISYGVWCPSISRAYITLARGIHFGSMGHSAPHSVSKAGEGTKIYKRIELLPEEALYLVERGTLFCTKESDELKSNIPGMDDVEGSPMSVQQAFAEMIGSEGLTLEKYQVFAYLKRLGFSITRANPPSTYYPTAQPYVTHTPSLSSIRRILSPFSMWMSRLSRLLAPSINWWKPLQLSRWLHHDKNYSSVFASLRFLAVGHSIPLQPAKPLSMQPSSPYTIFFNLYKPSTSFKKTAPGPPDFSLVVVNARTTPTPSIHELTALFDVLPELPPPLPRQRRPPPEKSSSGSPKNVPPPPAIKQNVEQSRWQRLFLWAFSHENPVPERKPNPFMVLKAGKKTVVVAAVDNGSISFFRFGPGAFEEWPMA